MEKSDLKILYMGTPEMSAYLFEHMLKEGFRFVGAVSQEDKKVGRKGILTPSPVKEVASRYNVPVFTPHRIRKDYEWAKQLHFDIILTFAYGQIVPTALLDMAPLGAYNVHGSILPKYRGAAPIQRAIMNGERKTGLSLMRMVDKMDAGGVFSIMECPIEPYDDYGSMCSRLSLLATKLIDRDFLALAQGKLREVPQDESQVSFADKILPSDEELSVKELNATECFNRIRGLSPTPGAFVYIEGKKVKILNGVLSVREVPAGELRSAGKELYLGCKEGSIQVRKLQVEGKSPMEARDYLNGHHVLPL